MASAKSFASAGRSLCLVQPVSYDRCSTSGWPQICLRVDWKPNSNSLMAKSLRLKPKDEFANGLPRFRRLVVCCKSNSPVTPSRKFKVSNGELAGLLRQAKAMSSVEKWDKIEDIEYLMKIGYSEFSLAAWKVIANGVKVAKKKQHVNENQIRIVETEHLMEAMLMECISAVASIEAAKAKGEQSLDLAEKLVLDSFGSFADPFVFSNAKVGVHAFSPMQEAIDKFIQCYPPPTTTHNQLDPNKVVLYNMMQGPYLECLIQRAIQYKNENGDADVEIKYLILALTQDERFGKKFIQDFQIPHQTLTSLKNKKITGEHLSEHETFDVEEEIEACVSFLKNKYDASKMTRLIYFLLIKQKFNNFFMQIQIEQQQGTDSFVNYFYKNSHPY